MRPPTQPNPTRDREVSLRWERQLPGTRVTVSDLLGRQVMQTTIDLREDGETPLQLTGLRQGVYVVELLTSAGERWTTRLMISR